MAQQQEKEEDIAGSQASAMLVAELLDAPGNDTCFDCDARCVDDPWVSVTHGTFVCLNCAGMHRSFGVEISFVRSLKLDALRASDIKALLFGGNIRFREFLEEPERGVSRKVFTELSPDTRYFTPACDLYRRRLQAQVNGATDRELPTDLRATPLPPPSKPSTTGRPSADPASPPNGAVASSQTRAGWSTNGPHCELCKTTFTPFRRRHHCRKCGRCVCGACSPSEGWRPPAGEDTTAKTSNVRHCKVCSPPVAKRIASLELV
eukprot:TRINITY_DN51923_c0_g1_i1.p1 TRINITY_DN51923_c0_g1~~TRINITY_DN51923_c0_g1_i1.p1  ORF type:complete len:274 (-),score=42.63 TRINITY_DN51923_c0_g1_i1:34-822(-)